MKRLYLLRHAKSSWALPGTSDFQRPLNVRGNKQMSKLNKWFVGENVKPDIVLCSPAQRTLETLDGLRSSLNGAQEVIYKDLYNGSRDVYLQTLWEQDAETVMIIGHNPACDELSRHLSAPSSPATEDLMLHHFGTANLAVLEFSGADWSQMGQASGQLMEIIRAKNL